jgi:hypothetical protein
MISFNERVMNSYLSEFSSENVYWLMILLYVRQETGMGTTVTSSHQQIHNSAIQKHTEPILSINSTYIFVVLEAFSHACISNCTLLS